MPSRTCGGLVLALMMVTTAPAGAQFTPFSVDRLEPLPSGHQNLLHVPTGRVLQAGTWDAGVVLQYARAPLSVVDRRGGAALSLPIADRLLIEPAIAYGIAGVLDVGLTVPFALASEGDGGVAPDGTAVGDLRLAVTASLISPSEATSGFGLHAALPVALPTGDRSRFLSDGTVRVTPTLGGCWRALGATDAGGVTLTLGWQQRATIRFIDYDSGPRLTWALAGDLAVAPWADVFAMLWGEVGLSGATAGASQGPTEALAGARWTLPSAFELTTAVGTVLARAPGTPGFRALISLSWAPGVQEAAPPDPPPQAPTPPQPPPPADTDGDGLPDTEDGCPGEAEDRDGFEDGDGCPDPDNDGDTIADDVDQCPNVPEDVDGLRDADGCLDVDVDGDGIYDSADACPMAPEDRDGVDDHDGCPDIGD